MGPVSDERLRLCGYTPQSTHHLARAVVSIVREQRVRMTPVPYRIGSFWEPLRVCSSNENAMPSWPIKPGHKQISVELPAEQVEHLDAEASLRGLGRVGYLRQLIFDDMRRQARAQRQAARKAG
jgi:hypothetical protein